MKLLSNIQLSANKMQKKVKKHLETLKKQYIGDKKELAGLKGTLKAAANKIIGAKFITTIDSVKSENDQYEKTLRKREGKLSQSCKGIEQAVHYGYGKQE